MSDRDLCFLPAVELARRIRTRDLSALELMEIQLRQIAEVNPQVNAIVTLLPEEALANAARADEYQARGGELGPLHGLPVAHKDLFLTRGIRTTFGSPIFQDHVPEVDSLIVERFRQAGAIAVGKTNVPEFGAGSQTYNEVFGATLNPYDLSKTCGGSSGGAAVALACGMVPLADGSDLGASLRNPASFCNVVGFRPTPGRIPVWPVESAWFSFSVDGPLGRTVADVALMMSALAGPDPRSPLSIGESGHRFSAPLERDFRGVKIAWTQDLGELPVDRRVSRVFEDQRATFADLGCVVNDDAPDFADADEIFKACRAWWFDVKFGNLLPRYRQQIKDTIVANTEQGQQLTGPQLGRIEVLRTELYHRVRKFLEEYEFLILPVSQVPPFDVSERYVREINGHEMESYIDWMKSCYYITVTGLPAISVPCGFTPEGLPIGMQIVGRLGDDFGVLQLARAFEAATAFWKRRPTL